ncbi:MAG: BlaI/MecI/CopY family transcriptional regulator [Ruminococcaceae bacterium]|nr:BlaI/MecI/CopY family transcriptional regulator [Oscillospiraceae bacterium]
MAQRNINISDAELEVMKVIWNEKRPVTSLDICEAFETKGWKKTTIGTFLTRLVEKGALTFEKQGKLYYYTPLVSQREYRKSQTKNLISSLYNGSAFDFAVSFFKEQKLSDDDIKELKAIFEDKEV